MRNKVVFVCIALLSVCFFPVTANAQKTLLRGVLLDSLTHEGEPFATIRITNKHKPDNPVAMTVTDMDGRFEQSLTGKGDFTILFSSVGKSNVNVPFTLKGDSVVNLDTLFISEDVKQLKNVEIVAQKPLIKMEVDKMSYSIADDADAKSNSLLDMLRKVPMVTVDGNDNITVNGSSNFKVFVDGKPNVMLSSNPSVVLKNMPATSVKNIEVITNPGAKYDAEGVGGAGLGDDGQSGGGGFGGRAGALDAGADGAGPGFHSFTLRYQRCRNLGKHRGQALSAAARSAQGDDRGQRSRAIGGA